MRDGSRRFDQAETTPQAYSVADRAITSWPSLDPSTLQGLGCDTAEIAACVSGHADRSVDEALDLPVAGSESEMLLYFG